MIKDLDKTHNESVRDFQFFVEYKNSLTVEELAVSTIDFEEMGIY
jgi:hypothetical protein